MFFTPSTLQLIAFRPHVEFFIELALWWFCSSDFPTKSFSCNFLSSESLLQVANFPQPSNVVENVSEAQQHKVTTFDVILRLSEPSEANRKSIPSLLLHTWQKCLNFSIYLRDIFLPRSSVLMQSTNTNLNGKKYKVLLFGQFPIISAILLFLLLLQKLNINKMQARWLRAFLHNKTTRLKVNLFNSFSRYLNCNLFQRRLKGILCKQDLIMAFIIYEM